MALTDNGCGCARPLARAHDSPNTSPPGEGPAVLHCIRSRGPWRRPARQRRGMRRRSHDPRVAASPAADCDKAPADAGAVVRSWDLGFQAREPPVPAPLTRLRDCVKPHRTPIRNGFTRMCASAFRRPGTAPLPRTCVRGRGLSPIGGPPFDTPMKGCQRSQRPRPEDQKVLKSPSNCGRRPAICPFRGEISGCSCNQSGVTGNAPPRRERVLHLLATALNHSSLRCSKGWRRCDARIRLPQVESTRLG